MTEESLEPIHWLPRVALLVFAAGLASIVVGFFRLEGAGLWFRGGATAWLVAYFIVLADNFKRKLPVRTRGGTVHREDGAFRYALPFIPLVVAGLIAFLVVLTTAG